MQTRENRRGWRSGRIGVLALAVLAVALIALTGCSTGAYPVDFFQEMHYSPAVRKQEGPSMSVEPGTVAFRSGGDYGEDLNADLRMEHYDLMSAEELTVIQEMPIAVTPDILEYGNFVFQRNCAMCHGAAGDGDGLLQVSLAFENAGANVPKNLTEDDTQARPAGEIYMIIARGNGDFPVPSGASNPAAYESMTTMPPFEQLLSAEERWMLVAHIRSLSEN